MDQPGVVADGGSQTTEQTGLIEPVAEAFSVEAEGASHRGSPLQDQRVRRIGGIVLLAAIVVAAVFMLLPKESKGEPLSLKFKQGQQHRYRMFLTLKGSQTLADGKVRLLTMTMGTTIDTEVASVSSSGATLDVTLSNIALHTGKPFLDQVPNVVHTQIQIGADGAFAAGEIGVSALVASRILPGWDVFAPVLPSGAMNAGSSWDGTNTVSLAPDSQVQVHTESTLQGILSDKGRLAVIKSTATIPVQTTVTASAVAGALGVDMESLGFPPGADPRFAYDGSISLDMTSRLDLLSGSMFVQYSKGTTDYTVKITGWPPSLGEAPKGEVHTSASFSVVMRSQPLGAPPPANEGAKEKSPSPQA